MPWFVTMVLHTTTLPAHYLDNEALRVHIDYDLDVKVFANGEKRLLDVEEYERRKGKMNYPGDLVHSQKKTLRFCWLDQQRTRSLLRCLRENLVQTLCWTKESIKLCQKSASSFFLTFFLEIPCPAKSNFFLPTYFYCMIEPSMLLVRTRGTNFWSSTAKISRRWVSYFTVHVVAMPALALSLAFQMMWLTLQLHRQLP